MLIVAHRGFSAAHPENSVAAIAAAIAAGTDYIETDVRLTRDGVAVCWHDPDLKRLAGRDDAIAELTHAELNQALGTAGRAVLALETVLALARGCCSVMLDVKVRSDEMARAIVAALEGYGMLAHTVFGMRDPAQHAFLQHAAPALALLAMPPAPEALDDFVRPGVAAVRLWEHEVTAERIARIRAAQCDVWVTAGLKNQGEAPGEITDTRLAALHALDVDAVLVNDPALAASVIARCDAAEERRKA